MCSFSRLFETTPTTQVSALFNAAMVPATCVPWPFWSLGEESRMVITGDGSQVDLKPNVPSGLFEAEKALAGVQGIDFVRFSGVDVVRHPVVGRIIEAYDVHRSSSL